MNEPLPPEGATEADDVLGREIAGMLDRRAGALADHHIPVGDLTAGLDRIRADADRARGAAAGPGRSSATRADDRRRRVGYLASVAAAVLLVAGGFAVLGSNGLTTPAGETEPAPGAVDGDGTGPSSTVATSTTLPSPSTFDSSNGAADRSTTTPAPTGTAVPTTAGPDGDDPVTCSTGPGTTICCFGTASTTECFVPVPPTTAGPGEDASCATVDAAGRCCTGGLTTRCLPTTSGSATTGTGSTGSPTTGTAPPGSATVTPWTGTMPATTGGTSPPDTGTTTPDPEDCVDVTTVPGCPPASTRSAAGRTSP